MTSSQGSESRRAVSTSGIQLKDFVKEVSRHIGKDYKKLARAFGIDKTEVDSLDIACPGDLKEQINQFFIHWQRKEGRDATIERLKQGLIKEELWEVLEKMENFNKEMPVSVHEENDSVIIETTPTTPSSNVTVLSKRETSSLERHHHGLNISHSLSSSSPSMSSVGDGGTPVSASTFGSFTGNFEYEVDVAFTFPSSVSAQSIMDKCKRVHTTCVITGSHNTSECKISGTLNNCCRTLHGLLRSEMYRSKQCHSKSISVRDQDEWSQLVGSNGCINKAIRHLSGATVWIDDGESFPKNCSIKGFPKQVQVAEELIERAKQGEGKDLTMEATAENILVRLKKDLEELCHFVFID